MPRLHPDSVDLDDRVDVKKRICGLTWPYINTDIAKNPCNTHLM